MAAAKLPQNTELQPEEPLSCKGGPELPTLPPWLDLQLAQGFQHGKEEPGAQPKDRTGTGWVTEHQLHKHPKPPAAAFSRRTGVKENLHPARCSWMNGEELVKLSTHQLSTTHSSGQAPVPELAHGSCQGAMEPGCCCCCFISR